ncbi:MAG: glycosyltransferase family 4 protein [Candidatus Symbiothrix sp.]|jgi:glycosyltransferase involved in cell wall biosynthesis|nr:glycosyltransferase family 4 protein [Candidatus Symbiothrix sp.]
MKILIVSQYFWPESFKINGIAIELKKRGHEVTVLTGKPNYPNGRYYKGYGFFSKIKDTYSGIPVYRVPIFTRGNGSGIRLSINYLSFVLTASIFMFFHRKKYDVSFVFGVSPITTAYPAIVHKKMYGTKMGLWVQDLWPESVAGSEKLKSQIVYRNLTRMVKYIYLKSDIIFISSKEFRMPILEKCDVVPNIKYLPNWAEDIFLSSDIDVEKYKNIIPEGFIVMFAGNIAEGQDIDHVLQAILETHDDKDIKWVFVGTGSKKDWIVEKIKKYNLEDTVSLLGRYPYEEMPHLYIYADVLLVTLKDIESVNLTLPSRTQSYMAFGKPIMTMAHGAATEVVNEAMCGFTARAGDYLTLANNIRKAKSLDKNVLKEMGNNGKKYYYKNFSKDTIIFDLVFCLEELSAKNTSK